LSAFDALDVGLVVATHGRHMVVETPEGVRVRCHPRGKKSDVVVGDRVRWMASGDEGVVEQVEPRQNLLFRQDEWKTKSFAANLDQILVLVASEPVFSESQLARSLIAAEAAGIPARIGLNKTDLPAAAAARERLAPYRAMGTEVVELALKSDPAGSREVLLPLLTDRATLVLGPSGAGKSTLVNLLVPAAAAQVGEISQALGTGRHTTTSTNWYWLQGPGTPRAAGPGHTASIDPAARGGALIDSPGFQEFGLRQLQPADLAAQMPDLRAYLGHCRFANCLHTHEPGCGVRAAAERGEIAPSRLRVYGEILEELQRTRW
jgi:ribosome biogenesis GTPase